MSWPRHFTNSVFVRARAPVYFTHVLSRFTHEKPVPETILQTKIPSRIAYEHSGEFAYQRELESHPSNHAQQRYVGYAFRADSRPPYLIEREGGFRPRIDTRTAPLDLRRCSPYMGLISRGFAADYCAELHWWNSPYSAFVSTSLDATVASRFLLAVHSYIYVVLIDGGIAIPFNRRLVRLREGTPDESLQEVAVPHGIGWEHIVAYRQFSSQNIYVRPDFPQFDPPAWYQIYQALTRDVRNRALSPSHPF